MLTDLFINNFAIIDSLHVRFGAGFNVLTGETGAGKSIVLDAVDLLLGGRARAEVIRSGTDEAVVEAIFDLQQEPLVFDRLQQSGLAEESELMVRRIVSRSGRNRVFVNGSPVPLAQLRELTGGLVNIYGQHEHQSLQRPDTHLGMLDRAAGLDADIDRYRSLYDDYQSLSQNLNRLELAERDRQQRLDMLSFQQQELSQAQLYAGEDEELERERLLLQHAEKLTAASAGGYEVLYAGQQAVFEQIAAVAGQLESLQQIDPNLASLAERLRGYQYGLEDVASELRDYSEKLEFDPQRQQQIEDRVALLAGLKRKYAPTIPELLSRLREIEQELEDLGQVETRRRELEQQLEQKGQHLHEAGTTLSNKRRHAADRLSERVETELNDLAMAGAHFSVQFTPLGEAGGNGLERGEFFLAANPGEQAQPLAKIASGGELSRIMLALRLSVPDGDGVKSLILDEVDAGIGGEAATAVGAKIKCLGEQLQLICVTHLPQVAAFADHHYQVRKEALDGRTSARLQILDDEARVAEMARMLGGARVGRQALDHARELVKSSSKFGC